MLRALAVTVSCLHAMLPSGQQQKDNMWTTGGQEEEEDQNSKRHRTKR